MPSLTRFPLTISLLCGLLSAAAPAAAQFDTATVLGTVRDSTGGFVPGATVTLTNLDTGVAAVKISDANGSFEFVTVRVGRYQVTAELDGFAVALAPDFAVQVGARQRVDLTLSPGQLSETIEVSGAATRLEAFNALNRTNFRAPNGNRSSPAFGTITSTYDARQLQLGVKLSF